MKKKTLAVLLLPLLLLLASASRSEAREWLIVGPRALGMGGANVAVANDSTAAYWNPAAYGFFNRAQIPDYGKKRLTGVLSAGAGIEVHEDLGSELEKIFTSNYDNFLTGTVAATDVPEFFTLIDDLKTFNDNPNRALTTTMDAGLGVQVGNYGIGAFVLSEISARGNLDLVNIGTVTPGSTFTLNDFTDPANYGCTAPCTGGTYLTPSDVTALTTHLTTLGWNATQTTNFINAVDNGLTQANIAGEPIPADIVARVQDVATLADSAAGTGASFADNDSRLFFKGLIIAELPVTMGYAVNDFFSVGGNFKLMRGRTYNTSVPVFNTRFDDALDAATTDHTETNKVGVDVGALYRFGDVLRLGVVARNINSPSFDMKRLLPGDPDSLEEDTQVRAGAALKPLSFITLAVDVDVTENDTTISSGYKSRNIGGGVEVELLKVLKLRGGIYKNLAEDDIGPVYTAGLGLSLLVVNLDVGASISGESTSIDSNDVPQEIKVELALSAIF